MRRTTAFLAVLAALTVGYHRKAPAGPAARPPHTVAILGDSVAHGAGDEAGAGMAAHFPGTGILNLGINGARTVHVLRHLRRPAVAAALGRADAVIVSIGGNDLFGDTTARLLTTVAPELAIRRVTARVQRVVAAVRRVNPRSRIYVLGLYNPYRAARLDPLVARWDSALIEAFAATPGVSIVRIADLLDDPRMLSPLDHFHPSSAGYAAIAARVAAAW